MAHGDFVWYELVTTDTTAARTFYEKVIGWTTTPSQIPGMNYSMFNAGAAPVAGLTDLPAQARSMGAPPHWLGYVGVDDVDAATQKVKSLGGSVYLEPMDIPQVGRFSLVTDPQGAVFALFKGVSSEAQTPPDMAAPHHVAWHELLAGDVNTVLPFYESVFGWSKDHAFEMGPAGTYQVVRGKTRVVGGMFNKPAQMSAPAWNYYLRVGGISAACARVKQNGGSVHGDPMEVPGGDWIVQAKDPQGAAFALLGTRD